MQLIDNTLTPSQLWIAIESGAYPPNSLFRDQDDNIFIFTGKLLQVHETDKEDNVYVGLCVGDKLEFIGVWDECRYPIQGMTFEDGILDNFETIERKEDDDKCT